MPPIVTSAEIERPAATRPGSGELERVPGG